MIGSDLGYGCLVPPEDAAAAAKGASSAESEAGSIWMEGTLRGGGGGEAIAYSG